MKLLKQPWFLIAIFLLSIYSYKIADIKKLSWGANVAHADESNSEPVSDKKTSKQEMMKVDLLSDYPTSKVKSLKVATYQNLDIQLNPYEGDKILLKLEGKGRLYFNDGQKISDWLDVKLKGGKLNISSYSKDNVKMKFKDLFGKNNRGEKLMVIVSFPRDFTFKKINVESVQSDIMATAVNFKEISLESVSGDTKFIKGKGDKISISSVSGDIDAKDIEVKSAAFKSVSGDATVKALVNKPDFSFESVSGDLKLSLPKAASIDVNFESMTGQLDNEFGAGTEDSGKLKISSLSGDAEVTKIK